MCHVKQFFKNNNNTYFLGNNDSGEASPQSIEARADSNKPLFTKEEWWGAKPGGPVNIKPSK